MIIEKNFNDERCILLIYNKSIFYTEIEVIEIKGKNHNIHTFDDWKKAYNKYNELIKTKKDE